MILWDQKLNRGSKRKRFIEEEDNFHMSKECYLAVDSKNQFRKTITKKTKFELETSSGNNSTIQNSNYQQENYNDSYKVQHIENIHFKVHNYDDDQRKHTQQERFSSIDNLINCKLRISTRTNPYEEINSILNEANQRRNTIQIDCTYDVEEALENNNYSYINSLLREAFLRRHH